MYSQCIINYTFNNMNTIKTNDGYIALSENGNTWVGGQAHTIMHAFYKVCRELNIEPNNHNLQVLATKAINQLT